ncbi:MAG: nucleotidyltransferase domain-containing protein [Candidatus Cloacimonadaceae bacterium]|nr:nucleotidyltransferase domain-containing protein [Candidatus Cloacimonadaceae bacterium]MDP3113958.1 nucleotidyltransferase domain-containing protein [Candidatus Cloacimonadaceae bacterium]
MFETNEVKDALKSFLIAHESVIAAWEGGSAATGSADQYSDLDLIIITEGIEADAMFEELKSLLKRVFGIVRQFRMPEPCWHGMSQCFYLLRDTPDFFYCDLTIADKNTPDKFTEPDRHGKVIVWFDQGGVYSASESPASDVQRRARRLFHTATDTDFLTIIELHKAIARRHWIDSLMNYIQFINRNLVILLNLKYRVAKADFGIGHAQRDYPTEVFEMLEKLLRVCTIEDISQKSSAAIQLYEELKQELKLKLK